MKLPKSLRTLAFAGMGGIAIAGATATIASAHYTYTQCDRDGDRCWRVRCDDDGDDCRRVDSYYSGSSYYYHRPYYHHDNRQWVCDRDGDNCHWSYYGRPGVSFGFGW